jgi:hypothetical protein
VAPDYVAAAAVHGEPVCPTTVPVETLRAGLGPARGCRVGTPERIKDHRTAPSAAAVHIPARLFRIDEAAIPPYKVLPTGRVAG